MEGGYLPSATNSFCWLKWVIKIETPFVFEERKYNRKDANFQPIVWRRFDGWTCAREHFIVFFAETTNEGIEQRPGHYAAPWRSFQTMQMLVTTFSTWPCSSIELYPTSMAMSNNCLRALASSLLGPAQMCSCITQHHSRRYKVL